jgi:hypothetical protein
MNDLNEEKLQKDEQVKLSICFTSKKKLAYKGKADNIV